MSSSKYKLVLVIYTALIHVKLYLETSITSFLHGDKRFVFHSRYNVCFGHNDQGPWNIYILHVCVDFIVFPIDKVLLLGTLPVTC